MENTNILLGKRIKKLRQERGLSQEQLALKADVNKSFMGEIERGIASPTVKTLEKIASTLELTLAVLFTFDETSLETPLKPMDCIDKINYELRTRPVKEQQAVYKVVKTFLNVLDKKDD